MSNQSTLDFEGFKQICEECSGGALPEEDIDLAFRAVASKRGGVITFENFEKTFASEVPTGIEMETKVVRTVREWMFQNKLSSEMAFDALCRASGRFVQRSLTRAQFHRSIVACDVGLSAAETDAFFALLTEEAGGELTLKMW